MPDFTLLERILYFAPPLLVAVVFHEVAHGWAADRLGDPTARDAGRITLNPIKHIDPFLTIILPAILIFSGSPIIFGGAKPVPFNPRNFANPKKGAMYVAAAGPLVNFAIALICGVLFKLVGDLNDPGLISWWLYFSVLLNVFLALFNLLPVPPLDGGRIAVGLLPNRLAYQLARLEPVGILLVVALIYFGIIEWFIVPVLVVLQWLLLA